MHVQVTKADGTTEYFKIEKLRRSLRRSGATPEEVNLVVSQVLSELYEGILTQEIYRRAYTILREQEAPIAARYSLRRALFSLGPTGFPFELLLARLFTEEGYKTRTGIILEGHCASHEIDFAAFNDTHSFVGEAKFHARPGIKTDLQVAMYSYARLLDLRDNRICQESVCDIKEFWLVTNTKFTSAAERYANCVGVNLLSWDFPKNNNLHDRIQRNKIYPVTVLQSLNNNQISVLIDRGIITCKDLLSNPSVLRYLHISTRKHEAVMAEAEAILHGKITAHNE
jgi:ATP cone domain